MFYSKWSNNFSEDIEVYPVQLPGRENRIGEHPINEINELCDSIIYAIKPYLDIPFAIFGHSMGGIVSFELARKLAVKNMPLPKIIFISATVPPHILEKCEKTYNLSEKEFLERLVGYDNINTEMFKFKEFYEHFLPTLRADFKVVETYKAPKEKLSCPIVVCGGNNDSFVPVEFLKEWNKYSEKEVEIKIFEGNHFYISNNVKELCSSIIQKNLD